jgi:predicted RNA-binding Zn-ribbon protein involved in translation (DUF1610 family)
VRRSVPEAPPPETRQVHFVLMQMIAEDGVFQWVGRLRPADIASMASRPPTGVGLWPSTPMPVLSCPNCRGLTPRELESSARAMVNYYRCADCGHVWTTDKKSNEIVSHVTPLTRKPLTREG